MLEPALSPEKRTELAQTLSAKGIRELTVQDANEIARHTQVPLRTVQWVALDEGIAVPRYERTVGSIGISGQKKLLQAKAIVVGLGGLGGFLIEELARMGLGRIVCVDHDVFDETNLNRQLLCTEQNLGKDKVEQAGQRLKEVNAAVEFKGLTAQLQELPKETWGNADLVFDCLDNINDRLILAGKCGQADVPVIHGAVAGWFGQVAVIWPGTGTLENMYGSGKQGIERQVGTPAFTAAVAASLMAAEAVKILLGKRSLAQHEALFFDLLNHEWQNVKF